MFGVKFQNPNKDVLSSQILFSIPVTALTGSSVDGNYNVTVAVYSGQKNSNWNISLIDCIPLDCVDTLL